MFVNRFGEPLSASGVRFKLAAYVKAVAETEPSLQTKHVTPDSFRHAVHFVSAGVDITIIRNWLGHVSLDSTNHYAKANLETGERHWNWSTSDAGRSSVCVFQKVLAPISVSRGPQWSAPPPD
ncbi:tyrosine-type recombinase/integrase [Sinorhizobium kostiense]|uniref:tyrosine-type recombinase/integrase n=1 Tax=Sinorhizobium kostiense TaxID=76747 RepID=UPI001F34068A|nr:tyrosine-type recombinase/integrase [Sinorhizobium kostiense]